MGALSDFFNHFDWQYARSCACVAYLKKTRKKGADKRGFNETFDERDYGGEEGYKGANRKR